MFTLVLTYRNVSNDSPHRPDTAFAFPIGFEPIFLGVSECPKPLDDRKSEIDNFRSEWSTHILLLSFAVDLPNDQLLAAPLIPNIK